MDEASPIDIGRLFCLANDVRAATAEWTTHPGWEGLSKVLADARDALGMDVAFVSRFVDGHRRFEVVSVSADSSASLKPGDSDPLLDTYCKLVADGSLPSALGDSWEYAPTAALEVTKRLAIRAYLSARVVLKDGRVLGTLCCFSHTPRKDLRDEHAAALQSIADALAALFERGEPAPAG
jgi:GAF domain-containing protein